MQAAFHTASTPPTGKKAWLGVFAILLLQVASVSHAQHEHELLLKVESHCEVCLTLDKNGNAPPAQIPSHEPAIAGSVELAAQTSPSSAPVRYMLPSRGPPTP